MSQCNYQRMPDGRWTCLRCLRVSKTKPDRAPKGECKVRGLGDYFKSVLEWFGLTRKRWSEIRTACGIKQKCGCGQRQEKANRWGDWLKIMFRNFIQKMQR